MAATSAVRSARVELALPFELIDGIASGGAEIAVHPIVGLQWRWVGTDRLRGRNFKLGSRHLSPLNSATSRALFRRPSVRQSGICLGQERCSLPRSFFRPVASDPECFKVRNQGIPLRFAYVFHVLRVTEDVQKIVPHLVHHRHKLL